MRMKIEDINYDDLYAGKPPGYTVTENDLNKREIRQIRELVRTVASDFNYSFLQPLKADAVLLLIETYNDEPDFPVNFIIGDAIYYGTIGELKLRLDATKDFPKTTYFTTAKVEYYHPVLTDSHLPLMPESKIPEREVKTLLMEIIPGIPIKLNRQIIANS